MLTNFLFSLFSSIWGRAGKEKGPLLAAKVTSAPGDGEWPLDVNPGS